jgi:hypothetical protein
MTLSAVKLSKPEVGCEKSQQKSNNFEMVNE